MPTKQDHHRRTTPQWATRIILGAVALLYVTSFLIFPLFEQRYFERAQEDGHSKLRLVAEAVDRAVGRYDPIPELIAREPVLIDLLLADNKDGIAPFVNEKLRHMARSVAASDIYVMDRSGTTVASSNYREETSFIGKNFAFRPYFQNGIEGEASQYHALGTTSGERGFFFSAPILDGIEVIGVLTLKVTVESIEAAWTDVSTEIIVSDPNGIVFLSSRPDYRLRALAPISEGTRERIAQTRQYPLDTISPIPFSASIISPGTIEVELGETDTATQFLSDSIPLTLAGWHAIALSPADPIRKDAIYALFVWNLAFTVVALVAIILLQRRARILETIRINQSQNDMLEKMVRSRTKDLKSANESLRTEVVERRNAENQLRKTQKDLVQAGKLAALGQMSAALSHEINQPLAAVKSYADNAKVFLERERYKEASENISHISEMTDRMARISGHLRNFARRPGDTLSPIPVSEVVVESIALTEPLARTCGVETVFTPPDEPIWILGGRLRLQQVLVNILSNAIDAMNGGQRKQIEIWTENVGDRVKIMIRDTGPGLPKADMDQVFEAFFTTKRSGAGMGLGLSISYNIVEDFGGKLTAFNHEDGGAVFCVDLRRAESDGSSENKLVAE